MSTDKENLEAYKQYFEDAVEAWQPYLQAGGKYAHLMPLGKIMTKEGPAILDAEIERLNRRVIELLEANNREVERRRAAEAKLFQLETLTDAATVAGLENLSEQ